MVDQAHKDHTFRPWCRRNYELIHARLCKLLVFSRKSFSGSRSTNFSNHVHLPVFSRSREHKSYRTWEENEFNRLSFDDYYSSSESEGADSSSNESDNLSIDSNLETFKKELIVHLKEFSFHKPRTVPKRNHSITRDELIEYIRKRFKDLEHLADNIDEYSRICNVNQFLCCHLLNEGLYFYSMSEPHSEPEFTIIENTLFRQMMFQLKSILLLLSFVKRSDFRSTKNYVRCRVFPEAEEVLKYLIEKQLVRNLFIALLSSMNECYNFYKAKIDYSQSLRQRQSAENMDNKHSGDFDWELLLRHSTHYLNSLLDVITTYFMTFKPKEEEIKCLMVFLPHVYDVNKMYNLPEMSYYLKFLFEEYSWDSLSGFYPISRSDLFFCLTTKEFDSSCKTNLTLKLSILLMVMLNPKIYRFDLDFNLLRIDERTLKLFKDHSESLFYRGVIDEASSSMMNVDDFILKVDGEDVTMNVDDASGQKSLVNPERLKELKKTRKKYADVELMLDFVIYGAYMDDENKKLECFGNNVLHKFLLHCDSFIQNEGTFDTAYSQVYNKVLKMVFTFLFFEERFMSKTWYRLLQYEASCKVKLESLMRMPVIDKINTAVYRKPGMTLNQVINLFMKVYQKSHGEFMFRMLQSITESYNSIMPERSSLLYSVQSTRFNIRYYRYQPEPAGEGAVEDGSEVSSIKSHPSSPMDDLDCENITINNSDPDHMLVFPNAGFSWHERNRTLLDLVNVCCQKNMMFVEPYPRLALNILRFALHLSSFHSLEHKIPPFLNSVTSVDLQFPSLFNRVVSQLKSLVAGDLDRLPKFVYEELVARDGLIESERAVRESVQMHMRKDDNAQNTLGVQDPSLYIRDHFKTSQRVPGRLYGFSSYYEKDSDPSVLKEDYLKDVSSYRINANTEDELAKSKPKPFQMVRTKPYTFPLVSGPSDVRKALSNLGLGTTISCNLVEMASLLFKLIRKLDPLPSNSEQDILGKKGTEGDAASVSEESLPIKSRLAIETGNYSYLDVVFTILSSNFYPGTELFIGDMLKSIASVHVRDNKLCKMALAKFRILLESSNSALGRKLTRWEFINLMECLTSILSYIPVHERYTLYSDSDDLLELTKYVLRALDHVMSEEEPRKEEPNSAEPVTGLTAKYPKITYAMEYYIALDRAFGFLLVVSRGPMGLLDSSKAPQYLYEQILLHGSPVAYQLVRCSNVGKSRSALLLVCNVFKRDFLLSTLHNLPCYNLKSRTGCDRCYAAKQGVDEAEFARTPGAFSWFLSKIPIFSANRSGGYIKRKPLLDKSGRNDQKRLEKGCEVCYNLDFNQKPLLISTAHDAFKDALLTYSNEVSCDLIGNIYTNDTEFKTITLFLMSQFAKRKSPLNLSTRTLAQIKYYLHSLTTNRDVDSTTSPDFGLSVRLRGNKDYYNSIIDVDMEQSDLALQNKLKFLSYARHDKASSLSNLREMPTFTLKTMTAYLSSVDEEMMLKIVDDRLFLSIVYYVRDTWRTQKWTNLYLMKTLTKVIRDERYAKLLMIVWPSIFNDLEGHKVDFKGYNPLKFSKLTYMFEIIARYSPVFPYFYQREKDADRNLERKDDIVQNKLNLGKHPGYDDCKHLLNLSMESIAEEMGASFMDYAELTSDIIHRFCENERELYYSVTQSAEKLGFGAMNKLWNFNSYSMSKHNVLTKLILPNSLTNNKEPWALSIKFGNERYKEGDMQLYASAVNIYNGALVSFVAMFRSMIKIYDSYNPYKFHRIFDIDLQHLGDELKLILQLSIIKRMYTHKSFDDLVNILVKLGHTLLTLDKNNHLLKTKVYHVINHLIEVASSKELEDSVQPMGGNRGDPVINKILVSKLSETSDPNTILDALFTDSVENHGSYADIDVLGHIAIDNCIHGKDDECEGDFVPSTEASKARRLREVPYYRKRVMESLYLSLEGRQPSCRIESLRLLTSVLKGLSTYEATKIEHDTGTLFYSSLGSLSLEKVKNFVSKLLMHDFSECKSCRETESMCERCRETLVEALNVLQALTKIHQFRSFWFELKTTESETLADMLLRCKYLSVFKPRAPIQVLQPTMKVIEYFVNTTSTRIRSAVITWLNNYSDALLSHVCSQEFDSITTSYICSLLRIYKTSFVSLLNYYRSMHTFENNFAMILADLNCKFPLASTLQALVPDLVKFFSNNLDSDGSWLAILLCLQCLFPTLGAFETEVDFASQAPVKTKALELINLVVDATLRCSEGLLEYIRSYSSFNTSSTIPEDSGDVDYEMKCLKHDSIISMFDEILELKVSTTDCCLLLLRYILSLVQLPNGVATNGAHQANPGHSLVFKIKESTGLSAVIETLAKVCTANGATLTARGLHTRNFPELQLPGHPEPSVSLRRSDNTHQSLFSDLLSSILNLDSALKSYT